MNPKHLDPRLRELVRNSIALLGTVISRNAGPELYLKIEKLRKQMADLRVGSFQKKILKLESTYLELSSFSKEDQFTIAHSFSLMLELMNACENSFRTHLNEKRKIQKIETYSESIYYVLTAHPTEARSPENVEVFRQVHILLVKILDSQFDWHRDSLQNLLELAWQLPITRQRRPQVSDEADYIYSVVLNTPILDSLLEASDQVAPLHLRSWVGGDKDGHPGVNALTMKKSLELSRRRIIQYVDGLLEKTLSNLDLCPEKIVLQKIRNLKEKLRSLRTILESDGLKIKKLRELGQDILLTHRKIHGTLSEDLKKLSQILELFPALVIPLEFRESSEVVLLAAAGDSKLAIYKMIAQLKTISKGGDPRWYVRSFIISMASSFHHVQAGARLIRRHFKELTLPVVPLFEQNQALRDGPKVVDQMLRDSMIRKNIVKNWNGHLEVMLGYSDSAKEMGVLQSRLLISDTVRRIDRACRRHGVRPLFFHGSGGSVDRGGGSIQEQTAWLPNSTLQRYKATIQGEMVERTFSTPSILRAGIDKLANCFTEAHRPAHRQKETSKALLDFANQASHHYQETLKSPEFLEMVYRATPYKYLSFLKIGSRPTKRGKSVSLAGLRAIPWVLCWTQTRTLFPVWWGVGTAWQQLSQKQRMVIRGQFKTDPLFRSYVKVLGFTLAKVELPIWQMYLRRSGLPAARVNEISKSFQNEFLQVCEFVKEMSGERNLLWYRPWLSESIHLRTTMIHPLSLLQIITLERGDSVMMRETVAGIALGMLTTG